jgi:hypothetical protein
MLFSVIAVLIVTTMMTPNLFGLQSFTQWGGMYVDGWCSVYTKAVPTETQETPPKSKDPIEYFSCPTTRVAWFAPMHNQRSCILWAQSWCGREHRLGWKITEVYPYYRRKYLLGNTNVCTLPSPDPPWFVQPS